MSESLTGNHPVLSVVTVVFNDANRFSRTLKNIFHEKCPGVEYIVIDGASTDDTVKVADQFFDIIDCLISEPDEGIYNAMNKGLDIFRGDYICFLNAGDFYLPGALAFLIDKIQRTKCLYYVGECQFGVICGPSYIHKPKMNDFVETMPHPCFIASRQACNLVGHFDETYKIFADYIWMNLARKAGDGYYLDRPLVFMEDGGVSNRWSFRLMAERYRSLLVSCSGFKAFAIAFIRLPISYVINAVLGKETLYKLKVRFNKGYE